MSVALRLDYEELVAKGVEFGEPPRCSRMRRWRSFRVIPTEAVFVLRHMSRAVVRVIGGHSRCSVDQGVTEIGF
jgi:hypothetical protein